MDERILERMLARYPRFAVQPVANCLAVTGLFASALVWLVASTICTHFQGYVHTAGCIFSIAASFQPLFFAFFFLVCLARSIRVGEAVSLRDVMTRRWEQVSSLLLFSATCVVVQTLFAVAIVLWLSFERVPILGPIIYLTSSWVPPCLIGLMIFVLCLHVAAFPTVSVVAAKNRDLEQPELVSALAEAFRKDLVIRVKLTLLGILPLGILVGGTFLLLSGTTSLPLELCARVIRAFVFSLVAAPFFLFFVHMGIEADRYSMWRSSRKSL